MPKEKINQPFHAVAVLDGAVETANVPIKGQPEGTPTVDTDNVVVQVSWHPDSWVQVSIEADVGYLRFAADNPDGETSDRATVYAPPLRRHEINKLIRTLRKARDQVHGRDE
jgi:hypothetical protein